jgi:hypothetical protein
LELGSQILTAEAKRQQTTPQKISLLPLLLLRTLLLALYHPPYYLS